MFDAHFTLHDVAICARGASRSLLGLAVDTLTYKGAARGNDSPEGPEMVLDVRQSTSIPAAPTQAKSIGMFGRDVSMYLEDETFFARGTEAYVVVRPATERAEVTLVPTIAAEEAFFAIAFALTTLLRRRGLFGLHAAALVRKDRGLLLVASSDSGKSTATLALVRQGWPYVTDDALLLDAQPKSILARTFRRDFCVDPDAAGHFPELAGHVWPPSLSDPGKWRVDPGRLYPGRHVPTCVPAVIVFPTITGASRTRLAPVESMWAFEHLLAQSAVMATPLPTWVDAQVQTLTRLLAQVRCYRMEAGRDILLAPDHVSALLAAKLGEKPS